MRGPARWVSVKYEITPIFHESGLIKIKHVFDCATMAANFLRSLRLRRACKPEDVAISPSSSARGTRRRHRVNDDTSRRSSERELGNLQPLARIRLRNQKIVNLHAELSGVIRIHRVFRVNVSRNASGLLRFSDDMQS